MGITCLKVYFCVAACTVSVELFNKSDFVNVSKCINDVVVKSQRTQRNLSHIALNII